jgi:hypothetical protein
MHALVLPALRAEKLGSSVPNVNKAAQSAHLIVTWSPVGQANLTGGSTGPTSSTSPVTTNLCPAGQRAVCRFTREENGLQLRRYWSSACPTCPLKAKCTPSDYRRISRWEHEAMLEAVQRRLAACVNSFSSLHSSTKRQQTLRMPLPLSCRKSAMVLKSGARRPVSHINSTLRCASR